MGSDVFSRPEHDREFVAEIVPQDAVENAESPLLPPAVSHIRVHREPAATAVGRVVRDAAVDELAAAVGCFPGDDGVVDFARGRPLVVVNRLFDAVAGNDVLVERFADDFLAVVAEGVDERGVDRADNRDEIDDFEADDRVLDEVEQVLKGVGRLGRSTERADDGPVGRRRELNRNWTRKIALRERNLAGSGQPARRAADGLSRCGQCLAVLGCDDRFNGCPDKFVRRPAEQCGELVRREREPTSVVDAEHQSSRTRRKGGLDSCETGCFSPTVPRGEAVSVRYSRPSVRASVSSWSAAPE